MNQRMYINYCATIYFLTSIYSDDLDDNLKNAIKDMINLLQISVDKYVIPRNDNTLKNFKVSNLSYNELLVKSKQVITLISINSEDKVTKTEANELLEYIKILYKENSKRELMEEKK